MERKTLSNQCPCCGLKMQVAAMSCTGCGVKVEGPFNDSIFTRLAAEDQQFLLDYLLSGFSIKALEENSELGYAAIRTRLDKLIDNTKSLMRSEEQKKAILEKLRTGDITVAEAKKRLEKL
ncbi:MAG: DUF2089 family protein [Planctomycetales bacterium]|nr:DUF2089 family protein [Planctomycetales bacterium]